MGELVKLRDSSRLAGLALCCQEEERKGFPYIGSKGPALSILTIPCTLVEASKGHQKSWEPEDPAFLLISCMTLDKSFALSLLTSKTEIEIPAQTISPRVSGSK